MKVLLTWLLLLLSGSASAGVVQLSFATWNKAANTVSGVGAAANAGKFITPATVTASGRAISIPATSTIAANAASVAITAVRLNPTSLVVGLTAQWLLGEGLQWANNSWTKNIPPGYEYSFYYIGGYPDSWGQRDLAGCEAFRAWYKVNYNSAFTVAATVMTVYTTGGAQGYGYCHLVASGNVVDNSYKRRSTSGSTVPAVESDFTTAASHTITDGAAQELALANVAMPVSAPSYTPVDTPIGSPRLDPVSNRLVQDRVRVEQNDPVANPDLATVTAYTVDAGAVAGQTAYPAALPSYTPDAEVTTGNEAPPDAQTDCDKYPEASGCKELGTPDDTVNLETQNPSMTVSPLSFGGGHASCPADKVVSVSGQSINIPYGHMCALAGWIKPILLAIAWFVAASIVAGSVRPE